ncbi:hypothetical protein [uncultured Allofournierella sp.]|uniref:hypothetical protein n=1 Tax=uncultured Allofournierella sp. TaxID=1940258 RepID=UPI0025E71145|nr:hypothetical protein [uncultured Fournierella sp.]
MLKGKTKSGFAFEIQDERLNNMELLDALTELDAGDSTRISQVLKMLFSSEEKRALYEHLRTPAGTVPIEAVAAELEEIFASGQQAKN